MPFSIPNDTYIFSIPHDIVLVHFSMAGISYFRGRGNLKSSEGNLKIQTHRDAMIKKEMLIDIT